MVRQVLLPPPPLALEELAEPHWEAVEGQQAAAPHQPLAASSEPVAGRCWEAVVMAELVVPRVHGWHLAPGAAWRVVALWAHCQHPLAPCRALGVVEAPVVVELGSVVAASVPAVRAGVQQQELRQPLQQLLQRGLAQRAMSPGSVLAEQAAAPVLSLQSAWVPRPSPPASPQALGARRYWVPCVWPALWALAPPS